jgi:hypothetical protein
VVYSGSAFAYIGSFDSIDSPGIATASNGPNSASVSLSNAHGGTIEAQSSLYSDAHGEIKYILNLDGPEGVLVPIHVQAHGYATGAGLIYTSSIGFSMEYSLGEYDIRKVDIERAASGDNIFFPKENSINYSDLIYVLSGTSIYVDLFANASSDDTTTYDPYGSSAHAFLDPLFTVDAPYADRFALSGLIGEEGAVHEPASWAMFIGGFGLVGSAMRRRQSVCFA